MAHTELGRKLLERLTEDLKELATVESFPKLDGRNMDMVVAPVRRSQTKAAGSTGRAEGVEEEAKPSEPAGVRARESAGN